MVAQRIELGDFALVLRSVFLWELLDSEAVEEGDVQVEQLRLLFCEPEHLESELAGKSSSKVRLGLLLVPVNSVLVRADSCVDLSFIVPG